MSVRWCLLNVSAINITLCRVFSMRVVFVELHFNWLGASKTSSSMSTPGLSSMLDSVAGVVVKHRNKVFCKKTLVSVFWLRTTKCVWWKQYCGPCLQPWMYVIAKYWLHVIAKKMIMCVCKSSSYLLIATAVYMWLQLQFKCDCNNISVCLQKTHFLYWFKTQFGFLAAEQKRCYEMYVCKKVVCVIATSAYMW
jgi:hypothetical protein